MISRWVLVMLLACGVARAERPRPGKDSVWEPPPGAIDRAHADLERSNDVEAALRAGMVWAKARPAALAFSKRLGADAGYMGSLEPIGPLLVGTLYFPLRAYAHAEPYVIDAANRLVRPALDDLVKPAEIAAQPGFKTLKERAGIEAWPPRTPPVNAATADGGVELTYEYPLRACHACRTAGVVRVAYQFGADGKYKQRRIVDVAPR